MEQSSAEWNHERIRVLFENAADFNVRRLCCGEFVLWAYAVDGLTAGSNISEYVIKPIMEGLYGDSLQLLYARALDGAVVNSVAKPCNDVQDLVRFLMNGFCVVLFPGVGAIAFEVKTPEKRGIVPPDLENTPKGPKDSFVETVRTNTSLVRRHLRTEKLCFKEVTVGVKSQTLVSIAWIQGLTNMELVDRMLKRLCSIDVNDLLSPSAVEEYVTGSRWTPFPLLQYTERPDSFCQGLLDGRVGLLVDGLPLGYLAPVDIGYLMNSPEDRSRDFVSASCVRVLRYAALLISLLLPGIYIALTDFHPELLTDALHMIISNSKENVPFSTPWEVLGLLVAFELLQETGVHLPQSVGQSVSIIGGIVVGTVGVEAGLVSPMALIVVSLAGVCGFVLPNRDLAAAVRVCRFLLAVAGSVLGLWGLGGGIALIFLHLAGLRSLGVRYLVPTESNILRKRLVNYRMRNGRLKAEDKRRRK